MTRTELMGLPIDALTMTETVACCERLIRTGGFHQHVALNAAKVVAAQSDRDLEAVIRGCSIINADGQSVVWASRILGTPLPERVPGIDLMVRLWELAARENFTVYLLGARDTAVAAAVEAASALGAPVVGYRNGYWSSDEEDLVVSDISDQSPDMLFLAIPSPHKELFLARNRQRLGVHLVVGVGGSFDVIAGITRRAPQWMQRSGLEWLFRLAQEPRRMFKRYLIGNARFTSLVLRYRLRRHLE